MSEKTYAKKSWEAKYAESGIKTTIRATAELHSIGKQAPYFSVTCAIYQGGRDVGGGAAHDLIAEHFPHLRPYLRWHLTSTDGPMHYIANALYWAESRNEEYFASTVVYGALPSDEFIPLAELVSREPEKLLNWLIARFPALMEVFMSDMRRMFHSLDYTWVNPFYPEGADYAKDRIEKRRQKLIEASQTPAPG